MQPMARPGAKMARRRQSVDDSGLDIKYFASSPSAEKLSHGEQPKAHFTNTAVDKSLDLRLTQSLLGRLCRGCSPLKEGLGPRKGAGALALVCLLGSAAVASAEDFFSHPGVVRLFALQLFMTYLWALIACGLMFHAFSARNRDIMLYLRDLAVTAAEQKYLAKRSWVVGRYIVLCSITNGLASVMLVSILSQSDEFHDMQLSHVFRVLPSVIGWLEQIPLVSEFYFFIVQAAVTIPLLTPVAAFYLCCDLITRKFNLLHGIANSPGEPLSHELASRVTLAHTAAGSLVSGANDSWHFGPLVSLTYTFAMLVSAIQMHTMSAAIESRNMPLIAVNLMWIGSVVGCVIAITHAAATVAASAAAVVEAVRDSWLRRNDRWNGRNLVELLDAASFTLEKQKRGRSDGVESTPEKIVGHCGEQGWYTAHDAVQWSPLVHLWIAREMQQPVGILLSHAGANVSYGFIGTAAGFIWSLYYVVFHFYTGTPLTGP